MRLEIGNFYVRNIIFGEKLSFESGILTINKDEALTYIRADERITEAELYIAKPGDPIRICPVKEAIEPRVRPDGERSFTLDIPEIWSGLETVPYMHLKIAAYSS